MLKLKRGFRSLTYTCTLAPGTDTKKDVFGWQFNKVHVQALVVDARYLWRDHSFSSKLGASKDTWKY